MSYYLLNGTFNNKKKDIDNFEFYINEHLRYLDDLFDIDKILFSGGKTNGNGGFIVAKVESLDELNTIIDNDPLTKIGVQEYEVTEFNPYRANNNVDNWIK